MEDDTLEVIYLALHNQALLLRDILEADAAPKDELDLFEYLLKRSEELSEQYAEEILNRPIPRPGWSSQSQTN